MRKKNNSFRFAILCLLLGFQNATAQAPLKLSTGELIIISNEYTDFSEGTIWKVGASGVTKLYDIVDYDARFEKTIIEGYDGNLYAITSWGSLWYRFKIDGSDQQYLGGNYSSGLVSTPDGVFGTSKGTKQNHGFIFGVKYGSKSMENVYGFNGNGERPYGKLLLGRDGMIYGTTWMGGAHNYGVIFKISPDWQEYTSLYDFDDTNGRNPRCTLVQDTDGNLYGTAKGGKNNYGVLFKIGKDGQNFQKLLDFADIKSKLITDDVRLDSDGFLYSNSLLFKIKTDGTELTKLTGPISHPLLADVSPDVPIMSPQDQSTDLPINMIFQIKTFSGSTQYTVQLSEAADFSSGIISFSNDEPRVSVKGLKNSTRYYARVKTDQSERYYSTMYGPVTSFETVAKQIIPDVFVSNPPDQLTGVTIHAFLKVKPFPGATNYTIELSESPNFSNEIIPLMTDVHSPPQVSRTDLKYNTVYYARVKTDVTQGYGKTTSFITRSVLGYTFISSPTELSNVSIDPLKITVNKVEGAKSFTIQVSDDEDFGPYSELYEQTSLKDNQRTFAFDGLIYGITYYARVKTDMSPEWGPVRTFTTNEKDVSMIDPMDGAVDLPVNGLQITITPVEGAYQYTVNLTESPSYPYSNPYFYKYGNENTLTFDGLKYNTKYYVWARSNRNQNYRFGTVKSFTTMPDPALSSNSTTNTELVTIYPNPSDNTFTLIKGSEEITSITLTDSNGIVVYKNEKLEEDSPTQFGSDLGKGIYFLKVVTPKGIKVHQLSKK